MKKKKTKAAGITFSDVRSGVGTESNSSVWRVAYCKEFDEYFAILRFSSYAGGWCSIYKISKEAFETAGTFPDDDYKTERMLRKGEKIYIYDNDRNMPETVDLVLDDRYEELCREMQKLR